MGASSYSKKKSNNFFKLDSNFIGPKPLDISEYDKSSITSINKSDVKYDENGNEIYTLDNLLIELYSYTTTGIRNFNFIINIIYIS